MERIWFGKVQGICVQPTKCVTRIILARPSPINAFTPNHTFYAFRTYKLTAITLSLAIFYRHLFADKEEEGEEDIHRTTHCLRCMHPCFSTALETVTLVRGAVLFHRIGV